MDGSHVQSAALGPWLVGPWTRWVRDWADLSRLSFLVGALVTLVVGDQGHALRLFLTFLVCLIPRLIAVPLFFDVAFGVGMSLQGWGNVSRVFWTWPPYHDIVHCLLTMATAALIYFVLVFLRLVPDLSGVTHIHQRAGIALLGFAIGTTVNALYEEYEWFDVNILGGHLLEYYTHDIHDLLFGGLGGLLAGGWLALWTARRWSMRRDLRDGPLDALRGAIERRMRPDTAHPRLQRAGSRRPGLPGALRGSRLTRTLFGDWTAVVRDVGDLARLALLAGLLWSVSTGRWDSTVRFGLSLAATIAVRWLVLPRVVDLTFCAAMLFQAWGGFAGVLGTTDVYDDATNLVVSAAATPVLYLTLIRARVFPEFEHAPRVHRRIGLVLAAMSLGFCAGVYYELYVWLANNHLGADLPTSWDGLTRRLGLDWLGSVAGALMLLAWDARGWGTRRRAGLVVRAATAAGAGAAGADARGPVSSS